MSENVGDFVRTPVRDRVARMVAEDRVSDTAIGAACGVTERTIGRWKRQPAFQEWVAEHRSAQLDAIKDEGISNKRNRVDMLQAAVEKLQQVISARAADPLMAGVAGGTTGVLVAEPMLVKVYDAPAPAAGDAGSLGGSLAPKRETRVVYKYAVDTALLKEVRGTLEQAAKELGQWTDKSEQKFDGSETFLDALRAFGRGH